MPMVGGRNTRYGGITQRNYDQDQEDPPILGNGTNPLIAPCSIDNSTSSSSKPTISQKKMNFSGGKFRGLGCAASSQSQAVSVPAVIRTSANWELKKLNKKKKQHIKKNKDSGGPAFVNGNNNTSSSSAMSFSSSCVTAVVPDVWCGPGIGLTTDADDSSVGYLVSRTSSSRPPPLPPAGRTGQLFDVEDKTPHPHRERPSCSVRRMVAAEDNPFMAYNSALRIPHTQLDAFGSRHHRDSHSLNSYDEGLAEILMLQNRLLLGGRFDGLDRYRDLRLDVDNMSYEELLDLGDKIGHVSTGLREDEIDRCLRNVTPSTEESFSLLLAGSERKCSICQEEFEDNDQIRKLSCGHSYHIQCIKQWLQHKNACPVCKAVAKK